MVNQEYIIHYGVLGMKWGQRKSNYRYTSLNTRRHSFAAKRLNKKVEKLKRKGASAERIASTKNKAIKRAKQAKASQQYDDLQAKYAKSASVGKTIVADLLVNPQVRNSYQRMVASGSSKVGAAILAGLFGDAAGRMDKHLYIKSRS